MLYIYDSTVVCFLYIYDSTVVCFLHIYESTAKCFLYIYDLYIICIFVGLRASNVSLQKLKCSKCDFQAYYEHQYQEHIATHTDQTLKCKCCKFVAFEKSDLVDHFKVCVVERRWRGEYDEVVTCVND